MPPKATAGPSGSLVNVAVMAAIRRPLTYRVRDGIEVKAGQRVRVPLGARQATGVVLESVAHISPGFKVRDIARVLDPKPVLTPELLKLGLWIQDYYLAPIGEVFEAMLPLRSVALRTRTLRLTEAGRRKLDELSGSLLGEARGSEDAVFLAHLADHLDSKLEAVRRKFSSESDGVISRALDEGWAILVHAERERNQRQTLEVRLADAPTSPLLVSGPVSKPAARPSPVARRILDLLERHGPVLDHRDLLRSARASFAHLKKLSEAGWVQLSDSKSGAVRRIPDDDGLEHGSAEKTEGGSKDQVRWLPELTSAQVAVLGELDRHLERREFSAVLLHGVTGSGKTEIYLRLISRCLEQGRTALMLVPEIALTPAIQMQFVARFGDRVVVLHSGLSETGRDEAWWRARNGEARVVLGTRSAVFAPLSDLGVVVVDEEHESSYKQEETPRYHGRDVAVVRARLAQALVVLGSATPSLESMWNARQGKYYRCLLPERIGRRPLASVEIVDMRGEFRETHMQVPISRRLREEIERQLSSSAQTMILLNRRGYSWFLLCRSCGQSERCRNCSISLTYHRREHRLICHYCGYSARVPSRCTNCESDYLYYVGEGTEKIEQKFAELFPQARVARLDRDVARRAGSFQRVLSDFREGKIDILVGTQLIAKGHDFPGVTLVGVVSADTGLGLPDFRAAERTFQLLTQAAGRAGRGDSPGRVLVQTFYPDHYAIRLAAGQNYDGFFAKEMGFRRVMHYPPSTALANVIAQGSDLEKTAAVAKQVGEIFDAISGGAQDIEILGPSPAPLARIKGRYRIQFLLKSRSRVGLRGVLRSLVDQCEQRGIPQTSLMIDIDPVSIM